MADLRIDLSRLSLQEEDGLHVGSLDVAVFCGDTRQQTVGELWERVDLKLKPETWERAVKDGFAHSVLVPVTGAARYVKAVVYDYRGDLTGAAVARMK